MVPSSYNLKEALIMANKWHSYITKDQLDELKAAREQAKKDKAFNLMNRINAILFLAEKCLSQDETAELCEVHRTSVSRWSCSYRKDGIDGLVSKPIPGGPPRLTDDEKRELAEIIKAGPHKIKSDLGIWTAPFIRKLIMRLYKVDYNVSHVRRILNELGFSLQYPRKKLSKADIELQKKWLEHEFPKIKKTLKKLAE
jgi:transposase